MSPDGPANQARRWRLPAASRTVSTAALWPSPTGFSTASEPSTSTRAASMASADSSPARAGGAGVELLETHRFGAEAVEVGRLHEQVSVRAEGWIPLVVGQDEDDVGRTLGQ